ncbi:hypothetical protein Q5530_27560 [Saccharothrix sp. BKS2]|uniref:hypothetical protein n=1 Tax=Saccharothrix sp. BKS2 TaxID=3064400 RepID=UPI0039E82126
MTASRPAVDSTAHTAPRRRRHEAVRGVLPISAQDTWSADEWRMSDHGVIDAPFPSSDAA